MAKARKYVVRNHFKGAPKRYDYEIIEYELPPLREGEILVKAEWISVDPYLRAYNLRRPVPYDQYSFQVGVVSQSRDEEFPVGTQVVTHKGWCDYVILDKRIKNGPMDVCYKVPDLKGLSPSLCVGAVGMPGATAYFGLLELCQPKEGETVVVTGAAGAVGSIVGQIAKIKGCRVIGFAGTDDKVEWLEKELGFDKAYNYKTTDILEAIKESAPDGVDCYFDNVGGEMSSIIISQMNSYGRVAVCGAISTYNENPTKMPKATILQPSLTAKQLKIEGFLVQRWLDRWPEAYAEIVDWIKEDKLKVQEHITEGFDDIFEAFSGMLKGENTGKAVVKI